VALNPLIRPSLAKTRRHDEVGALARDFDRMAERIEGRVVPAHQGRIRACRADGGGILVTIDLPLA